MSEFSNERRMFEGSWTSRHYDVLQCLYIDFERAGGGEWGAGVAYVRWSDDSEVFCRFGCVTN